MSVKDSIRKILDMLPEDATWDQAFYHLDVRRKLEEALIEADKEIWIDHDDVFRELLGDDELSDDDELPEDDEDLNENESYPLVAESAG